MATPRENKMADFYSQCLAKGYTDMTDEQMQLKAKVIATDLGLNYTKNLVSFFEEAKKCYEVVSDEKKKEEENYILQKKEADRKKAMKSELILTLTNRTTTIKVYLREDDSVYHTLDDSEILDGAPEISVRNSNVYMATYHPSQAVYTGATVGGITTGGIHYTKPSYSEKISSTGNGYVTVRVKGQEKPIDIRTATVTKSIAEKYKHHGDFKVFFSDELTCLCYDEVGDELYRDSGFLLAGKSALDAMTTASIMKDTSCLDIQKCQIICNILHSIATAHFPPTDEEMYQTAIHLSSSSNSTDLENALLLFNEISYHKDSKDRISDVEKSYEDAVQKEKEEAIIRREANQKKRKSFMIKCAVIAIIILAIVAAAPTVKKLIAYNEAVQLLEDKQFDEAKDKFDDLGHFWDSREMVSEADYRKAMDYFENGLYFFAAEIFEKITDYSDSETMANESNYMLALDYFKEKKYSQAMKRFEELENYKDSSEMYKESVYLYAKAETERGNSSSALKLYNKIPGYKDVDAYLSRYSDLATSFYIDNNYVFEIKYDENGKMVNAQNSKHNQLTYEFRFDENGVIIAATRLNGIKTENFAIEHSEDGSSTLFKNGTPVLIFDKYGNVLSHYYETKADPTPVKNYKLDEQNNTTAYDTVNTYDKNGNLSEVQYNYPISVTSNGFYSRIIEFTYSKLPCSADYIEINQNNVRVMFHIILEH